MAGRRSKKGEAAKSREERDPSSEKVRRPRTTLRDLPTYVEPYDERATNPVIELDGRTTRLPPPAGEDVGASLESLAQHVSRSAPPPPRAPVVHRLILPMQPRSSAPPPMPQAPVQALPSSMPVPPVAQSVAPVSTIRPRAAYADRFRMLSTIILSAGVGAIVALVMWGVRSGIDRASRDGNTSNASVAVAPVSSADERCAPAASPAPTPVTKPAAPETKAAATTDPSEPRPVTLDALPVAQNYSGNSSSSRASSRAPVVTRAAHTTPRLSSPEPQTTDEESTAAPAPAPRKKARAVSPRAAVTDAVQRASYAAHSCESGPQQGRVQVTFAPTGAVQSVDLLQGFGDIGVNGCVLRAFSRVRVPAFEGEPMVVRKTVSW